MNERILLVEEALQSRVGHYFHFTQCLDNAAKSLGYELEVACHKNADPFILNNLKCHPIFHKSRYESTPLSRIPVLGKSRFILHNFQFYLSLKRLLKQRTFTRVFLPTANYYHLWGFGLLKRYNSSLLPKCCIFCVHQPSTWSAIENKPVADRLAPILKHQIHGILKHSSPGDITLSVETDHARKEYERLCGYKVQVWPHPVAHCERVLKPKDATKTVFASLGFARHEKGSDILIKAIEGCISLREFQDCRFILQWGIDFAMPDGSLMEVPETLRNHPNVQIIDESLTSEEYASLLTSSDAIILPYRKSSYYGRLSRVSIEAAANGIPMIVTPFTHLENVVSEQGAGVIIENETPKALINGIRTYMNASETYQAHAAKRAPKSAAHHSAENFLQHLIAN